MLTIEQARDEARDAALRQGAGSAVILRDKHSGDLRAVAGDVPEGYEFVERVFLAGERERIQSEMRAKGWPERTIERHLDSGRY